MIFSQATAVSLNQRGILIRGVPASGKSTLALRLIARNATLVADDCLYLEPRPLKNGNKSLRAHHIARIRGKLAVRKVGIVTFKNLPFANIRLVVDLCGKNGASKGGSNETTICGVVLPRLQTELDATTPLRVESALL